jgi:hypothetical protein
MSRSTPLLSLYAFMGADREHFTSTFFDVHFSNVLPSMLRSVMLPVFQASESHL